MPLNREGNGNPVLRFLRKTCAGSAMRLFHFSLWGKLCTCTFLLTTQKRRRRRRKETVRTCQVKSKCVLAKRTTRRYRSSDLIQGCQPFTTEFQHPRCNFPSNLGNWNINKGMKFKPLDCRIIIVGVFRCKATKRVTNAAHCRSVIVHEVCS